MGPSLITLIWFYLTGRLQEVQLKPGDRVAAASERLYIVKRGTGQVLRNGPGGHEILLRVVRPGAVIEGSGGDTLIAETPLELLAVPRGIASKSGPAAG